MELSKRLILRLALVGTSVSFPLIYGQTNLQTPDCALVNNVPTTVGPCSILYTDPTMPIPTLTYGYNSATLSYLINSPSTYALVTLSFVEPNKTGAAQRVFTFKAGNQAPVTVDIFKLSGGQKIQLDYTFPVLTTNGLLGLIFTPIVGNALVSAIRIDPLITSATLSTWLQHPSGMNYLEVLRSDNSITKLWAEPIALGFSPDNTWMTVRP